MTAVCDARFGIGPGAPSARLGRRCALRVARGLGLLLLCMAGTTGLGRGGAPAQAHELTRELVLSGSPWIADAPTRIAEVEGLFDPASSGGVRVEYADSGRSSLARMLAGEADLALVAGVPLALELLRAIRSARPRAQWPVVLASIALSNRTHQVVAHAGRGIEEPADLAGHRVGLLQDSSGHFGWDRFAAFHRIPPESVRLVEAPPGEWAEGLVEGRFDAVVCWSPHCQAVEARLGEAARSFSFLALDSVSWLLVSTRHLAEQHPTRVERVLQGYARAIERIYADPEQVLTRAGLAPGVAQSGLVIWELALDWPVLANLEAKLDWASSRLGVARPELLPSAYILSAPLQRVTPSAVLLPPRLPPASRRGGP